MKTERIASLDALRGIAIAGMLFSGLIPFGVLPGWMYHAQNPPPLHLFNPGLPGISWVDLVFPLFLFAMGAAIPLAMSAALAGGRSRRSLALGVAQRAFLMLVFAVYVKHISPHVAALGAPWQTALYSLSGFLLLFPMLAGLPRAWTPALRTLVRAVGWGGAALLMFLFRAQDGSRFDYQRNDIIIVVLANVALSGALLWLATRRRPALRLALLCLLLALRLAQDVPGWGQWLWNLSPLPALVAVAFQQYLFIVVPGLFAGECLLRLARSPAPAPSARLDVAAFVCAALVPALLIGLFGRWWLATAAIMAPLCCALVWSLRDGAPRALARMAGCTVFLLVLGMAFEPYEGGIQKGRATLSFYFVGAGAGMLMLVLLHILIEVRRYGAAFALLTGAGHNPLAAYAGVSSLLWPVLTLSGAGAAIAALTAMPLPGILRAAAYTAALCYVAGLCARRGFALRM
ncbi:DUF5009 domain-containing protein [Massilia glaciei]|uniref:DUF5009 domain-containing protein n=1 Tax=Massilia glaciei TaxID=1524097 RepID=A0A2U2HF83_9BURK|nr:DUF5009 domain-containing protein [Massilia glaciei]PWF42707.1 DUF5009 domain-containing protein [Massilia glaciei]